MRTTLDLPDSLYRDAKRAALERGITLKALFTRCILKELHPEADATEEAEPAWWKHVGKLDSESAAEMERFLRDADFSRVDPEDAS